MTHDHARRAAVVALWAAAAAAFLASGTRTCPMALALHVPCPGCGMTRAGLALLHGDVARAVHLHPLSIVAVPALGALVAWNAGVYVARGRAPGLASSSATWVSWAAAMFGGALIAVWIARFFGAFGGPVPV